MDPITVVLCLLLLVASALLARSHRTNLAQRDRLALLERRHGPPSVGEQLSLDHRQAVRDAHDRWR